MNAQTIPSFDSINDAMEYMEREVDDNCIDNYRVAVVDDELQEALYDHKRSEGCCGSFDFVALVAGAMTRIGCNYGH